MFLDKLFGQSNKEVQRLQGELRRAEEDTERYRKDAQDAARELLDVQGEVRHLRIALKGEQDSLCRLEDKAKALAQVLQDTQESLQAEIEDKQDAQQWMEYYGEAVTRLREKMWEMALPALQAQLSPQEMERMKHDFDIATEALLEVGPPGPVWLFPPCKQALPALSEDDCLAELVKQSEEFDAEDVRAAEEALDEEREKFRKSTEPSGNLGGLICGQDVPEPPRHWMGDRGPD